METALFGVVGIITIVAAGVFSRKLGIAAPLILIVIGIGFSYIPGAPVVVPHEIILTGLLPPLLYSAALNVPVVDFRRNFSSISALSVALVFVTAFATGAILYLIFPSLSLAGGIAIGAVISPTDAVAATALGKKLGLPPRLVTILEGEGLVNDATALVLLRSAVAATATVVTFWGVVGDFVFAVAAAVAVGWIVGYVTVFVRSRLHDPVLDTVVSFAVPFIAFIPAEGVHASGVIAVVVAGLYSGHHSAKVLSPQARLSERVNWRTAQFVLENGVFLLMGLEISTVVSGVHRSGLSVGVAIALGLLMTVVVIVIRFLFVAPLLLFLRRREARAEERHNRFGEALERLGRRDDLSESLLHRKERAQRVYDRRNGDITQLRSEGLGWRGGVILSWSGMRGVVTLAAAQSLPETTPYRSQLVLIAFTVAIVTLLVQGGTLPWLIRRTGIRGTDHSADRRELASLLDEMGEAGLAVLESPSLTLPDGEQIDSEAIERVRTETERSVRSAWERAEHGSGIEGLVNSPQRQYRELRREVLQAEREALLEARASGTYPSRVLARAQGMLDLEETRLQQIDDPGSA
jgi:CPA1 family monovalent cation:H+ antiporter